MARAALNFHHSKGHKQLIRRRVTLVLAIFTVVIGIRTLENANRAQGAPFFQEMSHGKRWNRLDRSHHHRRDCRLAGRAIHEE
jgi:hypothetical protein